MAENDDRQECPGCGRKFNENAAKKHIPFCVNKQKMAGNKMGGGVKKRY